MSPTTFLVTTVGGLGLLMVLLAFGGKVPVSYNLRNLVVRWPITVMMLLAFTLVIGILLVMFAFVNGMYKLTEGTAHPGNVIVLSDGATDELFSNFVFAETTKIADWPTIEKMEVDGKLVPMASWEGYIVVNQPLPPQAVRENLRRRFLQLRAIDDPVIAGAVHGLTLHEGGSWWSTAGVREMEVALASDPDTKVKDNVIEVVLGEGIARELGRDVGKSSLTVGDLFEIAERQWVVTGIMKSGGSTFDSEIWGKANLVGRKFGKDKFTTIVVRTPNAETAQKTADELTTDFKEASLAAQPETVYYEKFNNTNQQFLYAFGVVAVFIAIGGVFGVMNTMFAAIAQRERDIGLLRIIGFARWQILASFLLESLLLAAVGGVLGCLFGSLANGWSATSIVSGGMGGGKSVVLKLVVDANLMMTGMAFALTMGAVGGLVPALTAMRVRPLEALR